MSQCNRCGAEIKWRSEGGKNIPINIDGTIHRTTCQSMKAATAQGGDPHTIGEYLGVVRGQINIRRKDGMILVVSDKELIKTVTAPECCIKTGMKVKLTTTKEGRNYLEPCPGQEERDEPSPPSQPAANTPVSQKEPRTSPSAAAPAQQQTERKKDEWADERDEFYELLNSTGREGIPKLIEYLATETDFFIAPSSTKYHDARDGGLLHHSLTTYHNLVTLSKTFTGDYPADSLIIIGLLHDICKANFYKTSTRNVKKELPGGFSEWVKEPYIDIDDQFPLGHGEKSVILLQRYIALTDTEIMAIRWHMMAYDDIRCSYAGNLAITNACGKFPIIVLMHIADLSASFLQVRPAESGVN